MGLLTKRSVAFAGWERSEDQGWVVSEDWGTEILEGADLPRTHTNSRGRLVWESFRRETAGPKRL
jgi:hypothetical protein